MFTVVSFSFWKHDKENLHDYVFFSELMFINNLNLVAVGQVL